MAINAIYGKKVLDINGIWKNSGDIPPLEVSDFNKYKTLLYYDYSQVIKKESVTKVVKVLKKLNVETDFEKLTVEKGDINPYNGNDGDEDVVIR